MKKFPIIKIDLPGVFSKQKVQTCLQAAYVRAHHPASIYIISGVLEIAIGFSTLNGDR